MTRYERKFKSVARSLSHIELMRSSLDDLTAPLTEADLLSKDAGRRFLDFYGNEGMLLALDKYGLTDAILRRGYDRIETETRALDERHTLIIVGLDAEGERHRLVELVVRRDRLVVTPIEGSEVTLADAYDVLTTDWLLLANPLGRFRADRPRLPGQVHPGLGIGERVVELLYRVVERLGLDGLVAVADHFHTAVLYRRELPYWDPAHEGRVRALEELLLDKESLSLSQASWAVEWGFVRTEEDAPLRWRGEGHLRAMHPELVQWLTSKTYESYAERAREHARFTLARAWFDEKWNQQREALLERPEEEV